MSRSKEQGTREERDVRFKIAEALRIRPEMVVRLAEEGMYDRGDLAFHVGEKEVVVECRDRSTMQVHKAMAKAKAKAGPGAWAICSWKRKIKKPGNEVRSQVGPPVVIMPQVDYLQMLQRLNDLERRAANGEI